MPPARRSAPTTSAACSARRTCSTPARGTPPARSTTPSCAGSRTRRSPTSSGCRPTSGCGRRPTASSAGPRGTWTSSTRSTASRKVTDQNIVVHFKNADGSLDFTPAGLHVDGPLSHRRADLRRGLRLPAVGRGGGADGEADHPVAVDGPLPRRGGRDRSGGLPRRGLVLGRPVGRLRPAGAGHRRAGLHLPAARRHQPGLPQRPARSGPSSPRRAATPSTSTSATSGRSTRRWPAGPDAPDRHHAHVPGQLPLLLGGRGRLRLRRRGAVRRPGGRRLLPRVRRRPLRRLRAAAVRAAGQARRPRAW